GPSRVDAAVVELDPLPDAVRARAQKYHRLAGRPRLVLFPPGRVEVVGARLDFGRTGIHTPVARPHAPPDAPGTNLLLGRGACNRDLTVGPPRAFQRDPVVCDEVGLRA